MTNFGHYRRPASRPARSIGSLAVRDASAQGDDTELGYAVPAFSDAATAPIEVGGHHPLGRRADRRLQPGAVRRRLALRSGLSIARPATAGTQVESIVLDESNRVLWLVTRARPGTNTVELLQVPAPPLTPWSMIWFRRPKQ